MARTVLVIDDERNMRWVLERALQKAGYDVLTAERGELGLQLFARHRVDLVLLDLKMPGMDGLAVLRELRQRSTSVPILLLTAYATVPTAVEALQLGASDYLRKPFDLESILSQINRFLADQVRATGRQDHVPGNPWGPEARLEASHSWARADFADFIGAAPALSEPLAHARMAAQTDYTVLIQGETGTGRQLLARLIHHSAAPTSGRRLVSIDCARLPKPILEQALLATFAEAVVARPWQQALGGSLLLANIETLDEDFVAPLLCHLGGYLRTPERPYGLRLLLTAAPLGGDLPGIPLADVWSALLTNAISVYLPPLHARREDLPLLLAHFAPQAKWSREVRALLEAYAWPGNVAELQRVVQQAAHLAGDGPVQPHHLPSHLTATTTAIPGIFVLPQDGIDLEQVEQDLLGQALTLAGGNKTHAARLLGMSRATFLYRLEKYGIEDVE